MTATEIRKTNEICQSHAATTKSTESQDTALESLKCSMLSEIAAQLAELNERLKNLSIRHIPSDIDPR